MELRDLKFNRGGESVEEKTLSIQETFTKVKQLTEEIQKALAMQRNAKQTQDLATMKRAHSRAATMYSKRRREVMKLLEDLAVKYNMPSKAFLFVANL